VLPDGDQMNECVDLTASNREEWLELSMEVPSGSDSWTAMGLNPWKSRMALWAERWRPTEPDGLSQNEAVSLGTLLEPVVADEYARATGRKIFDPGRFRILRSAKPPRRFATVDREIPAFDSRGPGVLEIKTTGAVLRVLEGGRHHEPAQETVPVPGGKKVATR
jgi:predicted phage-related endonuclease